MNDNYERTNLHSVNNMLKFFDVDFAKEDFCDNDWYLDSLLTLKEYIKYLEKHMINNIPGRPCELAIEELRDKWEEEWIEEAACDDYDEQCGKIYIGPTEHSPRISRKDK